MKILVLLSVVMFLSGCASVLSEKHYPIEVKSHPLGAGFKVMDKRGNLIHEGVTPQVISLYSGAGYFDEAQYQVLFTKEGYHQEVRELKAEIDEMYFANVTNVLGFFAVDPAGAMYELPDSVHAFLKELPKEPEPPAPTRSAPSFYYLPHHYHRPVIYRTPVVPVHPVVPVIPVHPVAPVIPTPPPKHILPENPVPAVPVPSEHHNHAPQQSLPGATVQQTITPIREKVTTYRTDQVDTIEHSETHYVPCTKETQPCQ